MGEAMKRRTKDWSQVVFFPRAGEEIETLVEGYIDWKKGIQIVAVTDMNGNDIALSPEEMVTAKDCLYDSIVEYTGPGEHCIT